jgi:hypothetical protein
MGNDIVPYRRNSPMTRPQQTHQVELSDEEYRIYMASKAVQIGVHNGIQNFVDEQAEMARQRKRLFDKFIFNLLALPAIVFMTAWVYQHYFQ